MSESQPPRSALHPEMASAIETVRRELPPWHTMSVERARRLEDAVFTADGPAVERVEDTTVSSPAADVPIRVYRPAETPAPVLVFYHGGGWVLGTLDSVASICRRLTARIGCVVVSVDYRLAPEHPFPAAIEDGRHALEWVVDNAAAVGGDGRVAVGGSSAGGTLAAVASLHARESNIDLAQQLLLYPVTDHAADASPIDDETGLLTRADMDWFWEQYLPDGVTRTRPEVSPLRATDHSNLPPTTVVTCGFDPLCVEGAAYADRLSAAGVAVEHAHYPRMAHGFLSMAGDIAAADRAMDDVAATVRAGFD